MGKAGGETKTSVGLHSEKLIVAKFVESLSKTFSPEIQSIGVM